MRHAPITISCGFLAVLAAAVLADDERSLGPREGVVLLANGELLAGTIIPAGDRYDIRLPSGEIRLRRSEVALVCRDAHECYVHKRSGIEQGRAADHLALAEWCLRNGLLTEGEQELNAARAADASHPRIRLVESRLALAKAPPPAEPAPSVETSTSNVALDDVARNLPPGAMENFTDTIQPLLLNYCSKGGCHSSPRDGNLKLEHLHSKLAGRSTTQRNLQRVLALVDRQDPAQSPLLQAPIRPHGPVASAIFTDRQQSQYRQLVQWVYFVAGSRRPVDRPSLAERTAPLLQAVPGATGSTAVQPTQSSLQATPDAEAPADGPSPAAPQGASSEEQAYTPAELRALGIDPYADSQIQRGAKVTPAFVPRDEFDPEIFNRRFFGG